LLSGRLFPEKVQSLEQYLRLLVLKQFYRLDQKLFGFVELFSLDCSLRDFVALFCLFSVHFNLN
jgi:hypothetical protein